jgi:hypothetical protein
VSLHDEEKKARNAPDEVRRLAMADPLYRISDWGQRPCLIRFLFRL